MREICLQESMLNLAMPEIGCGLDKLQWESVSEIIKDEFMETEINIVICRL